MARLTIRQASQQGFASTLTIHRHIKDGMLPVYEEGDTKLLEVDDLIAVFGEPGRAGETAAAPAPAHSRVDIHEFNRIRAELDQKNKKNMWLAADLAEVVRELKEKEARFEKERTRLLTVLEQAQALLLREVGRTGGRKQPAPDTSAALETPEGTAVKESEPAMEAVASPENQTDSRQPRMEGSVADTSVPAGTPVPSAAPQEPLVLETALDPAQPEGRETPKNGNGQDESVTAGLPPIPPEGDVPAEYMVLPEKEEHVNPLMPPLEDPSAPHSSRRMLGATTWLMLFMLAGGGFVFYEFRTKVMMGVSKVLQALS